MGGKSACNEVCSRGKSRQLLHVAYARRVVQASKFDTEFLCRQEVDALSEDLSSIVRENNGHALQSRMSASSDS